MRRSSTADPASSPPRRPASTTTRGGTASRGARREAGAAPGTSPATAMPASAADDHGEPHGSTSAERASSAGPGSSAPSASKRTPVTTSTSLAVAGHHADLLHPAAAVAAPVEVDDDVDRRVQLAVRRLARHPGGQRQAPRSGSARRPPSWRAPWRSRPRGRCSSRRAGRSPRRRGPRRPRAGRAASAAPGGPGCAAVISPAPSTLAGRASSADDVRVLGPQLAGVLDEHQPLVGVDQREQGVEQGGLAGAGAAADQERQAAAHHLLRAARRPTGRRHPRATSSSRVNTRERGTRSESTVPGRDTGASTAWNRDAVGQPQVDVRRGVVEAAAARTRPAAGRAGVRRRRRGTGHRCARGPRRGRPTPARRR